MNSTTLGRRASASRSFRANAQRCLEAVRGPGPERADQRRGAADRRSGALLFGGDGGGRGARDNYTGGGGQVFKITQLSQLSTA